MEKVAGNFFDILLIEAIYISENIHPYFSRICNVNVNVGNFLHTLLTEAMKNEVSINHVSLHYYASVTIINCDI